MYHRYFYLSNRILKTTNIMYVVRPIHTTRSIIIIYDRLYVYFK